MATITKRKDTGKWRAQVRLAGHKPLSKNFATKAQADEWARLKEGGAVAGVALAPEFGDITIAALIQGYREMREGGERAISDSSNEHYMLNWLVAHLGAVKAAAVSTMHLVNYCKARKVEGAGAYTRNMEISKLGTVYRHGGSYLGMELPDVVGRARPTLTTGGHIGGGGRRERRPTPDELDVLYERLDPRYAEVVRFAIASCMRRGEICRIVWSDVDPAKRCIWIRDRKDPRNKKGNDQLVPLLGEAWDILMRQPRTDERVFPCHPLTITKAFAVACRAPKTRKRDIPDLHFHDMRHEGISRLFEQGYQIQQVALVSGHKDWTHLRRYTNLKPESLHYLHGNTPAKAPRPKLRAVK